MGTVGSPSPTYALYVTESRPIVAWESRFTINVVSVSHDGIEFGPRTSPSIHEAVAVLVSASDKPRV